MHFTCSFNSTSLFEILVIVTTREHDDTNIDLPRMSAPKSRAKAKKEQIRQETELLNRKRLQLQECEAIEDLLTRAPFFKKFNGKAFSANLISVKKLPAEFEQWAFRTIETHMKDIYEETWGWKPEIKEAELVEESARFLFAFVEGQPYPVGFIHFRFELARSELSTVIWDLHVEETYQRKGLGKFLLQAVEIVSLDLKVDSLQVTLLKPNQAARSFFRKMKYIQHETSPVIIDPENDPDYNHEILFKSLLKKTSPK
jgi:GNAT superfamily N-acetyltransferase